MKNLSLLLFIFSAHCSSLVMAGPPGDIRVVLSEGPQASHRIEGEFWVAASSRTVWSVLTDYDHLGSFISSIQHSQKWGNDNEPYLVDQVMTGKTAFFKKRIQLLLKVTEHPLQKISFEDLLKKSFHSYLGSWELASREGGTQVLYKLEARPAFFFPDFLAVSAFRHSVKRLLQEVRDEILARGEQNAPPPSL